MQTRLRTFLCLYQIAPDPRPANPVVFPLADSLDISKERAIPHYQSQPYWLCVACRLSSVVFELDFSSVLLAFRAFSWRRRVSLLSVLNC